MDPAELHAPKASPPRYLRHALAHHFALALVLTFGLFVVGTPAVWTSDEGALLAQVQHRNETGGWEIAHPFPLADPEGRWQPLALASHGTDGGYVALGKHTAYLHLSRFAFSIYGYRGVVLLSALGALLAASAAARLARRLSPAAGIPALWLCGLASPLLFNAYVAWAHTLAAALVGWALVGLTTEQRGRRGWGIQGFGAVALAGGCLLRTEGLLAAIAVTLALVIAALRSGGRQRWWACAFALAGTVAGAVVDRVTSVPTLGPVDASAAADAWGGIEGRIEGLFHTWLRPDLSSEPIHLLLLVAAASAIGAAVAARTRPPSHPLVVGLVVFAAVCLLARSAASPTALAPGLLVACPALAMAGAAAQAKDFPQRNLAVTLSTFAALFTGAVLVTQYRTGGGAEWGGRYFALAVPVWSALAAPVIIRVAAEVGRLERRSAKWLLAAGLLIIAAVPNALAISHLHAKRQATSELLAQVTQLTSQDRALNNNGQPVVVSTMEHSGRWAWDHLDRHRWLVADTDELPELGRQISELGVARITLLTAQPASDMASLSPWYLAAEAGAPDGSQVITLHRAS